MYRSNKKQANWSKFNKRTVPMIVCFVCSLRPKITCLSCTGSDTIKTAEKAYSSKNVSNASLRRIWGHVPSRIQQPHAYVTFLCVRMLLSQSGRSAHGRRNDGYGTGRFTWRVSSTPNFVITNLFQVMFSLDKVQSVPCLWLWNNV